MMPWIRKFFCLRGAFSILHQKNSTKIQIINAVRISWLFNNSADSILDFHQKYLIRAKDDVYRPSNFKLKYFNQTLSYKNQKPSIWITDDFIEYLCLPSLYIAVMVDTKRLLDLFIHHLLIGNHNSFKIKIIFMSIL